MSHEPNSDQILTRWVDEGPEVAPERFVWAALDQVEQTPQRGSWRVAVENTPMLLKVAVPVLGAAAAIVLTMLIYGRMNPAPTGNPVESPAAVASPSVSPQPTRDPCDRDVVEFPAAGTLDVMWCIPRGTDRLVVPFTIETHADWADQVYTGGELLYFRPPAQPAVVVAVSGPDTVDEWLAHISDVEAFDVSDPETLEVAGGEAAVIDVTLAEGTNPDEAPPLIESTDLPLSLQRGDTARVWILEGPDEAVAVATSTTGADFEDWATFVGARVQSLTWGETP